MDLTGLVLQDAVLERSALGPVVSAEHKKSVIAWIDKGVEEGAELILDGRNIVVSGFENGIRRRFISCWFSRSSKHF